MVLKIKKIRSRADVKGIGSSRNAFSKEAGMHFLKKVGYSKVAADRDMPCFTREIRIKLVRLSQGKQ